MRTNHKQRPEIILFGGGLAYVMVLVLVILVPIQGTAQVVTAAPGEYGTFRLEITVNGRVAAKALVDTGATAVTLCSDLAKSLGLKLGKPADVATMNGPVSGRGTWLTSIEIGEIVIRNVPAIVMDNQDCTEVILGMSALRQLHAIVLSGDALILFGARIRQKQ